MQGTLGLPAGGQTQPQQPDQLEQLREQLVQRIADQMSGPEPTPPQYQPAQVSPQQGFAMARNPQLAGMLNQNIQAPAQAQFQQQQAAFEQAMSGRQQAATLGAGMVNAQTRGMGSSLGGRPALGTIEIDGVRTLVNVVRAPDGTASIQPLGPSPWTPGNVPAVPGVSPPMTYPRRGSEPGPATPVRGAVTPPAPAETEKDYRKNQAFIAGSNHLRESFRKLKAATAGRSGLGNVIGQELGEFKYGGAIPYSNPNAAFENELRTTLDTMIVAITGLSFPEQAFRRYRSELPVATDSEQQAMDKIDNVVRKFLAEQKSMEGTYPKVGGGQAQGASGQYSGVTLRESDFANANPGERERFLAGGGRIEP